MPVVIVPVLSIAMVLSVAAVSRDSLFLNKIPSSAPLPIPAIIAVGVARPNAQGQAITSTATKRIMAEIKSPVSPHQTKKVINAISKTNGTKTAATRSASA